LLLLLLFLLGSECLLLGSSLGKRIACRDLMRLNCRHRIDGDARANVLRSLRCGSSGGSSSNHWPDFFSAE
jgi:hypothetical protein